MADDTVMEDVSRPIFDGLVFTINPIPSLTVNYIETLSQDILQNGGELVSFDEENGRVKNLADITHIVSTTSDFPDYNAALDQFKHVVRPVWIEQCLQKKRLMNPRNFSPDPALFMSDVVICCCPDIPEGDQEAIIGGVLALGGQNSNAMSKMVTHLVAMTLDNDKCALAINKRLRCQIVLPHWFDDCLKLGRKIPEGPYTLPDPEIMAKDPGPVAPGKTSREIRNATTPLPADIPTPLSSPSTKQTRSVQAFKDKSIMLSDDLKIGSRIKGTLEELVRNGGGKMTDDVEDADIYICHYRSGPNYVKASQAGKDVGNLSWLYHLITHNAWTSPMRRMLHYPIPLGGIPGFNKYKISLSNYTGEARVYLENLVKATGAEFTKTFRQDNTHLITAHMGSEKCEAAKEWNIHVVNHLWLEESYSRCALQTLSDPRYTHFPRRTNLGEILGQTQIDRAAVEKNFFKREEKPQQLKEKKSEKEIAKSNALSSAVPRPSSDPAERGTPLATKKGRRARSDLNMQTPAATRNSDGKENGTSPTTGSRSAKARAISKLHDQASDIAKFQNEMKRPGGVVHGGRRDKNAEVTEKTSSKSFGRESTGSKRSFDEMDVDKDEDNATEEEEAEEALKKSKKAKKEKKQPIQYRMLLSKDERWATDQKKEATDKNKLREIGLSIIEDPGRANMLCAPKIVRTRKFVAALAAAPTIVGTSFLDFALKNHKLPPPEKHPLIDRGFEKQHGFRLDESLERARQNKKRLLKDWVIFCTEAVSGGWETFKDITEANGGSCQLWKGRTSLTVSRRKIATPEDQEVSQNLEEDEGDVVYLISEPKKAEFILWKKFREMAHINNMVPRIVRSEWLLFVAMAQYVHWDEKWELSEEIVETETEK